MNENILDVNALSKHFGSLKAVDSLSFTIEKGSIFGILGPNGSGKTTTLAMLVNAINPSSGSYSWFGKKQNSNQRKRIGTLLEKPNFYDYLSAVDNLKIIAEIRGGGHDQIESVLKQINLWDRKNSKFRTFSLGMKQRLAIGSVLLNDPEVLILDEPTNGLDPYGIIEVRNLIKETASRGKTIILASHLLDEVQKVCTHMLVLKNGVKIFHNSVSELNNNNCRFELNFSNQLTLIEILKNHPKCIDIQIVDDKVVVQFEDNVSTQDINEYCFKNGIILAHLSQKAFNLEKQILELLAQSK